MYVCICVCQKRHCPAGTGVRDSYGPIHGCWELKPGPLQELSITGSPLNYRSVYLTPTFPLLCDLFIQVLSHSVPSTGQML